MKKLRRNWSLKKSDISKSWSRIRKYSSPSMMPPIRPAFPITITQTNTLRRKPSRRSTSTTGSSGIGQVTIPDTKSVVRHHGGPVVGDGSNNDTTFYITLTIEQDDDDDDPLERIDSEYLLFTEFPPQSGFFRNVYLHFPLQSTAINQFTPGFSQKLWLGINGK